MRRRITTAIVAVTAFAVAVFGVPLAIVINHLYVADARTRLEREATLAARDIPTDFATNGDQLDLPTNTRGIAVALYAPSGTKVSGDGPDIGDRAVQEALANAVRDHEVDDHIVAAVPIAVNEVVIGVVRAETSLHPAEHRAHLAWLLMAVLGSLVVIVAGVLALVQANRLTRPLRHVRDDATRLGHGDFTIGTSRSGVSELDDVADALASTAQRLGRSMEREQAFSNHASHQLRTPIAALRIALESELAAPRPDPTLALNECLAVTDRFETIVTDLLRLAREPAGHERLDVAVLMERTRAHWHGTLAADSRRLILPAAADGPRVHASNAAIAQALDVLVDNAYRHGRGTVTLACEPVAGGITLSVTDEGPGSSSDEHSTGAGDDDRGGYGIGLALARSLVEAERGRLLPPRAGHATTYSIVLTTVADDGRTEAL